MPVQKTPQEGHARHMTARKMLKRSAMCRAFCFLGALQILSFLHDTKPAPVGADGLGWLEPAARFLRWLRTRRLAFHCRPQNSVDARLVAFAVGFQPIQHIRIETDSYLLFHGRPFYGGLL